MLIQNHPYPSVVVILFLSFLHSLVAWFGFDKNRQAILVCKIPKGSFYYIGKNGDIVSNKLTVIEEPSLIKKHTSRIFEPTMLKYCLKYIKETYGKQVY